MTNEANEEWRTKRPEGDEKEQMFGDDDEEKVDDTERFLKRRRRKGGLTRMDQTLSWITYGLMTEAW